MSLRTADYDYTLPPELIARRPLPRREDARMLVVHRDEARWEHRHFVEFPSFLRPGDLVVLNDTRVVPARVFSDGGKIELFFLEQLGDRTWRCLVRPGRKMRLGAKVSVQGNEGVVSGIEPEGERIVEFSSAIDLETAGEIPLPPYLERSPEPADAERYQTVFARSPGAVAAPTAGLHFTPQMLAVLPHAFITLHVGAGTFRGVTTEDLRDHHMHAERFCIGQAAAEAINQAQRLIAVGTTSARVLETCGRPLAATAGSTDLFLHPPKQLRTIGALLTNFHLPQSTLLMLVSAFAGRELILAAYAEAVRERYRFYSYGDCMLIL